MSCFTDCFISSLHTLSKPILFQCQAEWAHDFAIQTMESFGPVLPIPEIDSRLRLKVGKVEWKTPIGLAAGLDKNAQALEFLTRIAFGAVEIGTVTPKPQPGNPYPRLFRLKTEQSLRNQMGFNNEGALAILQNLKKFKKINAKSITTPIGINLGKNKWTEDQRAVEDYNYLYNLFRSVADYLVINISSPNTPGLRQWQKTQGLEQILKSIIQIRSANDPDLFIKIAPDMEIPLLSDIVELVKKYKLSGIIATNTTIMPEYGAGGVSGKLLFQRSKSIRSHCLKLLREMASDSHRPILIGVGGLSSFEEIWEYWKEGGRAVQLYTSFIYQGPALLYKINKEITKRMEMLGVKTMDDLLLIAAQK